MLEKLMTPLDRHFDDGLWAIGESFKEAADRLAKEEEGNRGLGNSHLPVNFLYRHAVELFLKSAIVTVHRFFRMSYGDEPYQKEPRIDFGGKRNPLHKTHSLKVLLGELSRLLAANREKLQNLTPSSWDCPPELTCAVDLIEKTDGGSTYFRYPKNKAGAVEGEKSSFLAVEPQGLMEQMNTEGAAPKAVLALKDDDNRIVEVFALQNNPLGEIRKALVEAASMMSGCALGLDQELVKGYGLKFLEQKRNRKHEGT